MNHHSWPEAPVEIFPVRPCGDFLDGEVLALRVLTVEQRGGDPNLISDAD